ncbi:unnamed protein product [Schistosoma curassoni]|uniref:OBG-type G domain-containing protein n=1 Tax=Schistosoma curassoni TaxID=6186 RepID=A0A3P8FBQ9_9TREM|nr:unnamed protein product [Schistosoma curassoni]
MIYSFFTLFVLGLADIYAQYDAQINQNNNDQSDSKASLPSLRHTNFLKHVERSSCILLVLDSLGFCKDQFSSRRNALAVAYLVLNQMERWSNGLLLEKPMACILNKIDTTGAMDEALETKYWLERMDSSEAKQHSQLPPKLLPSLTPKFESIELVSALRHTNIPGFQVGACCAMQFDDILNVCPIYSQRLSLISSPAGSQFALSPSGFLLMVPGQRILSILRRNLCISARAFLLIVVVDLDDCDPDNG